MEEKELIKDFQKGDKSAFEFLVKKYERRVFNLVVSFIQDRVTADDLAQEVFIKVYSALQKFQFKSQFSTWLYRITINHIKDYWRKKEIKKEVPLDNFTEYRKHVLLFEKDEMTKMEREKEEELRKKLVHKFLEKLPEKYKVILMLRDIQGFSYEEISKILKISLGTVESRLFRARRALRNKLSPYLKSERR
ncbi:MAG: RNA polymerase sigma factor [Candidatus Aminicenantia bacterium]